MAGVRTTTRCRPLVRDFKLQHGQPSDFVHSVVFESAVPYAVAMTCMSIHTLTMSIYSGCSSVYKEKILIWLTYWSFFTLTARYLLTAFNCWTFVWRHAHGNSQAQESGPGPSHKVAQYTEMPTLYKAQWVLQNASACSALIVSLLYWTVMYRPDKTESARSINSHSLNTVFVVADLLLSRAPVRIHHFIHAFLFISLYILFTLVYWAAGGQNHLGDDYIYPLLNYSQHPGRAVAVFLAVVFVGTPLLQMVLCALFRLRQWGCGRCRNRSVSLPLNRCDTGLSQLENGGNEKSREAELGMQEATANRSEFRGRKLTSISSTEEDAGVVDGGVDYEMADRQLFRPAVRPALQTNPSQVSCTDSTKALLT